MQEMNSNPWILRWVIKTVSFVVVEELIVFSTSDEKWVFTTPLDGKKGELHLHFELNHSQVSHIVSVYISFPLWRWILTTWCASKNLLVSYQTLLWWKSELSKCECLFLDLCMLQTREFATAACTENSCVHTIKALALKGTSTQTDDYWNQWFLTIFCLVYVLQK